MSEAWKARARCSLSRRACDCASSGSAAATSSSMRSVRATCASSSADAPAVVSSSVGERSGRVRVAGERAQHVERDDVARALPDRHHRLLAVAPGEREATRCSRCRRGTRAPRTRGAGRAWSPSTSRRASRGGGARRPRSDASASNACASRRPVSIAASDSSARSASTAVIAGWSTRSLPNAARPRACHDRLGDRLAHARGGAEHAVQPGALHHLDDRAHAAPGLAERACRSCRRTRPRRTRSTGCRACPSVAGCGTRCACRAAAAAARRGT